MSNDDIKKLDGLIYQLARSFTSDRSLIEDLYQQGTIGVLKAQKKYDHNSNVKFSTYARMYIYGEMYDYFNGLNKTFKSNRETIRMYTLINKAKELLTQELKKEPSVKEISNYLKVDEATIYGTIKSMSEVLSINYDYNDYSLDYLLSDYDSYDYIELGELMNNLDSSQKKVIMYKYFDGYSQQEIAQLMNISQSSVSRCEQNGISRMRKNSVS